MTETAGRQPRELASVRKRSSRGTGMEVGGPAVNGKAGEEMGGEATMLMEEWTHIMYL